MISKNVLPFLCVFTSFVANANEDELDQEITIVSATRLEERIIDVAAAANVITGEEFISLKLTDIADALDLIAGADVTRTGGVYGGTTSLFTRGTASSQTLILLNGQRFSSATSGTTAFQLIDPALIERVEFVRGARSSLFGSDAIGGVLQISTKGSEDASGGIVSSEIGSFNTYKQVLGGNISSGGLNLSGGLSHIQSDSIDAIEDDDFGNDDEDAYENTSVNLFAGYEFEGGTELNLSYLESQVEIDYDNGFAAFLDVDTTRPYREQTISVLQGRLFLPITEMFSTELNLGKTQDESDELDREEALTGFGIFNTKRKSIYWQNTVHFYEENNIIAGIDYYEEQIETASATVYDETERDNFAVFTQLQGSIDLFHINLGWRLEDNSQFGEHLTRSASANLHLSEEVRVFTSVAEGFRAPTFNDLYFPDSGNPELEPEESVNYELGIKRLLPSGSIELIAFRSEIDNLIQFVSVPENIGEAEIQGFEASLEQSWKRLNLRLSGTYLSPKDRTNGGDLLLRAKRKIALVLSHQVDNWNYGSTIRAYGQRRESLFNDTKLSGYELLDVYVNYEPSDNLTIGLKILNASDEDYVQRTGFNTEDRNYKANITYTF